MHMGGYGSVCGGGGGGRGGWSGEWAGGTYQGRSTHRKGGRCTTGHLRTAAQSAHQIETHPVYTGFEQCM